MNFVKCARHMHKGKYVRSTYILMHCILISYFAKEIHIQHNHDANLKIFPQGKWKK